ncbi:tRNA lysidine(34) synthetase TilS [Sphingosinicella sp. CPCC 101087]|uniref:tRNA lysidine(34) synthetase TilS n=1 Tax=Sphingosinicella sp. CPCC 101087 TaxID=2497754 RepID=UPI001FB0CD59|nr:tRNA lysidine(34) synthetase TilS [Sphingosinicella sp. CPCC 101087]
MSGGADSLALLLLAARAAPATVLAATVDHGLRAEAAAEADFVAALCARIGIGHRILRPAEPITGSVQAAARRARYALLETWRQECGLDWILTAHHADDQAETLLMRLNRGAGVAGLSGVRAVNGRVARPLLGWRRAELAAIVRTAGVAPVADPTNVDERFDRARTRRHIGDAGWIDPPALARSASALAEADAALDWTVERLVEARAGGDTAEARLDVTGVPGELRRRLLLAMLRRIAPGAEPRGDELSRLLETLDRGGTATLAGVKCRGGPEWRFEPAPPRRSKG